MSLASISRPSDPRRRRLRRNKTARRAEKKLRRLSQQFKSGVLKESPIAAELITVTRISKRLRSYIMVHGVLRVFEINSSKLFDRGHRVYYRTNSSKSAK